MSNNKDMTDKTSPQAPLSRQAREVRFWSDVGDSRVVFRSYGSVAIEPNLHGDVIIRQEPAYYEETGPVIIIPLDCAETFLRKFRIALEEGREIAAEIDAERPERDDEPEKTEPQTGSAHDEKEPEAQKSQPARAPTSPKDPTAAERMRRYRERQRNTPAGDRDAQSDEHHGKGGSDDRNTAPLQPELLSN